MLVMCTISHLDNGYYWKNLEVKSTEVLITAKKRSRKITVVILTVMTPLSTTFSYLRKIKSEK